MKVAWPHGHRFAFTIFDDTDWANVANVKPIYDLLVSIGMRTTKSTWLFAGGENPSNIGMTCEDPSYLAWLYMLQEKGFEIGLHNVAAGTSTRERIQQGFELYQLLFKHKNIVHTNHFGCLENIYWGQYRLSGWSRVLYNMLTRDRNRRISLGHNPQTCYFWGDLCQQKVCYVRNFVLNELNALNICPELPYHNPKQPFVNYWFVSTDAGNLERFLSNLIPTKIDKLVEQGGLCILYVHFAAGYVCRNQVHPEVRKRLEYIAAQNGWFAPVSTVLDFLRKGQTRQERTITPERLNQLELRWLRNKILYGPS